MNSPALNFLDKIRLLNQTTLELLIESESKSIIEKSTKTGVKILNADFGFVWHKSTKNRGYTLIYKTPDTPYNPPAPRYHGINSRVFKSKAPFFATKIPKERQAEYDVTAYLKSFVIIPISYHHHVYGNLVLCFKKSRKFNKIDRALCVALGNSLAQAMAINRLHHNLQDIKHTLDNTPEPLLIFDPVSQHISYFNQSLLKQTGRKKSQLNKAKITDIIHTSGQKIFQKRLGRILANKVPSSIFEVVLSSQDKQKIPAEASLQFVNLPKQTPHILALFHDLREKKIEDQKIRHAAFHDSLTGLANRFVFTKRLSALIHDSKKKHRIFGIIFLDLDRFKSINDTLGHMVGDALLREVANRLKRNVKRSDTVARFAGDEFVILLPNLTSYQQIEQVIERIFSAFENPFKLSADQEIYVTFSMGVSVFPKDGTSADSVLKNADFALYRAKRKNGNSYEYYDKYTKNAQRDPFMVK